MLAQFLPHFLVPHRRAQAPTQRTLRDVLVAELRARQSRNPRYSLRAFALRLAVDSATVSQVVRGKRRISADAADRLVARLGYDAAQRVQIREDARFCAYERRVLRQIGRPGFKPIAGRIARCVRLSRDDVNVALTRLLVRRRVRMASTQCWIVEKEHA